MFITEANISMSAGYRYTARQTQTETLTVWIGDRPPGARPNPIPNSLASDSLTLDGLPPNSLAPDDRFMDRLALSDEGKALADQKQALSVQKKDLAVNAQEGVSENDDGPELDPKLELIKLIVESFTGRKIRILTMDELKEDKPVPADPAESADPVNSPETAPSSREADHGWGIIYSARETYSEKQEVSFAAEGVIRTKDGKEMVFSLRLSASREFASEREFTFRAGDAKKVDPLVINFNGLATELTGMAFAFDLNADGNDEQVHFVKPGSGFLALDANGDGKINNGGELFGPQTGNGLAELAAYDADGNRWIDENDPIYNKLSVWSRDSQGNDIVAPLKNLGVGALYLGYINSRFDLKDQNNALVGQTNRFGIYLSQNGSAGSLQQIDLVG